MIKRPLAFIGTIYFLSVWVLAIYGFSAAVLLLAAGIAALSLLLIFRFKMRAAIIPVLICTVGSACLSFALKENYDYKPTLQYDAQEVAIVGKICSIPDTSGSNCSIFVKTDSINGKNLHQKIKVSVKSLENFQYGNKVQFKAKLYNTLEYPSTTRNSYKSNNVYLTGYVTDDDTKVISQDKSFGDYVLSFKQKMIDTVNEILPNDTGGLMIALVTGNTNYISDQVYNNFKICGVIHILSVSGMHFYYWTFFLFTVLCLFGVRERLAALISIVIMVLFMAFFGFMPSVVRSGIMMIIYLSGYLFLRKPDPLNSLGIAALLLTLANPYTVLNVGTLFSFAASAGLVLLMPKVNQAVRKRTEKIRFKGIGKLVGFVLLSVAVTVVATIFTFPVSVFYIGSFSLLSVLANLPMELLAMPLMLISGIGTLLAMVPVIDFMAFPFMFISTYLSKWTLQMIAFLSKYDYLFVSISENVIKWSLILIAVVVLLVISFKIDFPKYRRAIALGCTVLLVGMCFGNSIYYNNVKQLYVDNVGNGLVVSLNYQGHSIVIDGGGDYYGYEHVADSLEKASVKTIDVLISDQQIESKISYSKTLIEKFEIRSLLSDDETLTDNTAFSEENIYTENQYHVTLWEDTTLEFTREKQAEYVYIASGDQTILIVMKGKVTDETLPAKYLNPDIYISSSALSYAGDFSSTGRYVLSAKSSQSVPASVKNYNITGMDGTIKMTV